MWWFIPTVVGAILCLLIARLVRGLSIAGSVGGILPPWLLAPMAALAVVGPPWILWVATTRPGVVPSFTHLYLFGVLVLSVMPGAVCLNAMWFFARRIDREDRCPSCGHQLLDGQRICPECGGEWQVAALGRIYSEFIRRRSSHPTIFVIAIGFQHLLAFLSLVVLAHLLVPTPRVVATQRAKGTSSGTVFNTSSSDGPDFPFTLATEITSRVKTAASFGGLVPYLPSDVAVDVHIDGSIREERLQVPIGEPQTILISKVVRSRSDVEALAAEMNCGSLGISVAPSRDPLVSEAGLVRMIAAGYWPAPNPSGPTPTATMAEADRWLALGETAPPLVTFGIPSVVGVIAFLIALPRRHKGEPGLDARSPLRRQSRSLPSWAITRSGGGRVPVPPVCG